MRERDGFKDSLHWTHTERLYGGAALYSLDVLRAAASAARRERRPGWAVRGAARFSGRVGRLWRELARWWRGRGRGRSNARVGGRSGLDATGRT